MLRHVCLATVFAQVAAACTYGTSTGGSVAEEIPDAAPSSSADAWLDGQLPPEAMQGTPRKGGTLVVRIQASPPSLDTITDSDLITTRMLSRKVYQSLAQLDSSKHPDYPLQPVLAERWTSSPDGLTFTFAIRHGVRWHDGEPFTGQDVVATIRKILDPKTASIVRDQFADLDDIHTLPGDDFTLVVHYRAAYSLALRSLATQPIYPKHLLDRIADLRSSTLHRAPVGTGPFRFVEWDTANQKIVFARNEDYWGRKAYVDRVVYRIVKDPTVAYQMLLAGEFDLFIGVQPQTWAQEMPASAFLRENYNRVLFYEYSYSWIGWNELRPFFADAKVRLALTELLDREGMRQQFQLGLDRTTTCHFYFDSSNCDRTLLPRPYDPEHAVALLDRAGWVDHDGDGIRDKDGVPFRFTYLTSAASIAGGQIGAYMQSAFRKVGIDVEIKRVDWSIFIQMLREHRFDACSGILWGNTDVFVDPHAVWASSEASGGRNYISFANARADELIQKGRRELDDTRRAAIDRELGRLLYDETPYTWLYNRPALDLIRKTVHGIHPAIPWYDLQDAWIDRS